MAISIQTDMQIQTNQRRVGELLDKMRKGIGGSSGVVGRIWWAYTLADELNAADGRFGPDGEWSTDVPATPTEDEQALADANAALQQRWNTFYGSFATPSIPAASFPVDGSGNVSPIDALMVIASALKTYDDQTGLLQINSTDPLAQ